jgi:hypothetical protein
MDPPVCLVGHLVAFTKGSVNPSSKADDLELGPVGTP